VISYKKSEFPLPFTGFGKKLKSSMLTFKDGIERKWYFYLKHGS